VVQKAEVVDVGRVERSMERTRGDLSGELGRYRITPTSDIQQHRTPCRDRAPNARFRRQPARRSNLISRRLVPFTTTSR